MWRINPFMDKFLITLHILESIVLKKGDRQIMKTKSLQNLDSEKKHNE